MSINTARNPHDIDPILKTYETALNGNDIETILGLYGDTPVFMPQHAPALVGRDAVRAGYARVFDTIKLNVRFDVHEVQEAGEWAWARRDTMLGSSRSPLRCSTTPFRARARSGR